MSNWFILLVVRLLFVMVDPKPTFDQVQAEVDGFQKLSKSRLPITVVNSPSDVDGLPIHIPTGSKPMGGVFEGRIYLFVDNLSTRGEAIGAALPATVETTHVQLLRELPKSLGKFVAPCELAYFVVESRRP
jgi:hypothetical protein